MAGLPLLSKAVRLFLFDTRQLHQNLQSPFFATAEYKLKPQYSSIDVFLYKGLLHSILKNDCWRIRH